MCVIKHVDVMRCNIRFIFLVIYNIEVYTHSIYYYKGDVGMKKEKLLEIWSMFDSGESLNRFYSVVSDVDLPLLNNMRLFGKLYMNNLNEPYIEVSNNILSELIVPESLSMCHQKNSSYMTTYRVAVFSVNNRLFVVEGYDKDGKTVADLMDGYTHLFTATYDGLQRKWIIPLDELVNTFNYQPVSCGVNKDLGKHIMKLCQLFEW